MKTGKQILEHGRFQIPFRVYGDHPNVLLCISGVLQTMAVWRSITRRFAPHFRVIIFDMPGVGRSKIVSGSAHVTVEEQLDIVHALVEHASPAELTLAGSSWGTAIAAGYAARNPDAVRQLVLSSFGMKPNAEMERVVAHAEELYATRNYAAGADLIIRMFGQQIGPTYKRQITSQFASLSDASASVFHEHCRNILTLGHLQDTVDLSRIRARTLIVNGSEDRIIDLADMSLAEQLIPDCECLLVEGVGHFLHFERPDILDFYENFMVGPALATPHQPRAPSRLAQTQGTTPGCEQGFGEPGETEAGCS
jgi:pimeloyl-ACP methyl ester carboxylesterase